MTLEEEIVITALGMVIETGNKAHRSDDLRDIIELQIKAEGILAYGRLRLEALPEPYSKEFEEQIVVLMKGVDKMLYEQEHGVN